MCLLGSVVIVLHAPPDKPVERVEEILAYALQPGMPCSKLVGALRIKLTGTRIPHLLPRGRDFLNRYDL